MPSGAQIRLLSCDAFNERFEAPSGLSVQPNGVFDSHYASRVAFSNRVFNLLPRECLNH